VFPVEKPSVELRESELERKVTHFRWVILALVFFATTVNYLDRMVMGILAPDLQKQYQISDVQYGYIQSAFAMSYALGQLGAGGFIDKVGVRLGYGCALIAWSLSSILHVLAKSAWGFGIMRVFLGISESPNFPSATKTLSEWFPKRERAFAFGFVNAGTNMGAVLAPAVVPWLANNWGWQWAFIGTGMIGLVWILFWFPLYRPAAEHPNVSRAELELINSDPPEECVKVPWLQLFTFPQAWAFAIGKFLTDSMWWFFITWAPKFLYSHYNLNLVKIGPPLIVVYLMSDIGSVAGGWFSSAMIKRGVSVNRARKTAMFVCACGMLPVLFAQNASELWVAVLILGLATASHQGFSSNLYTLVSDMFPKACVASVAGFGGTWGYVGASLFQIFVGYMVNDKLGRGNYTVPFFCASIAYLVAFGVIHLLAPRIRQIEPRRS
jgi:ACS family hexuronate transporter-like MFS transporter